MLQVLLWQNKRKEICVPLNGRLLISVGELSARKNHKVVIKALQSMPNEYWYVIVGKGLLKEKLESFDKTHRVVFLGFRNDIPDLLKCSDIFVFPSIQEGLPVSLMEAIVSGLPCIASKIRGNVDLISENKNLFKPSDYKELKAKILSIDKEAIEATRLSNHSEEYWFDSKIIDKKMFSVYDLMNK